MEDEKEKQRTEQLISDTNSISAPYSVDIHIPLVLKHLYHLGSGCLDWL